jgi:hypothetical protein
MQGTSVAEPTTRASSEDQPRSALVALPRSLPAWLIGVAAVLVLASPMIFTRRALGTDWTNHLWLVWKQGIQFHDLLHPSYFVQSDYLGIFYPHYAFYGGTIYAITGGLAALLGERPILAYVAVTTAAIAMAYGGWVWLAYHARLRGWRAHVPALVFATSAYYLANLYGRGAWGEFMGTSAIPLVLASGISLLRAERWRIWPSVAFAVSMVILSGSHNITLLWSVLFFAVLVLLAVLGLPRHGREVPRRRLGRVALLGGLAVGVNLWFLLPDIAYAGRAFSSTLGFQGGSVSFLDDPGVVFDPLREVPKQSGTPGLFVQLPVLALAWGLAAVAISWRSGLSRFWKVLSAGLVALMALLLVLVFTNGTWHSLPHTLQLIQFPYRLQTYVLLCLAGLVLIGLRAAPRRSLATALVAVVAFGSALAVWQIWDSRSDPPSVPPDTRDQVFASQYAPPPGWADSGNYRDHSQRVVAVPDGRSVVFPPATVVKDQLVATVDLPPGPEPIKTNIAGGPYFVNVKGVRRLGRTADGFTVIAREGAQRGPVTVTASPAATAPVKFGSALSVLSLLSLLVLLGVGIRRTHALSGAAVRGYLETPAATTTRRAGIGLRDRWRAFEASRPAWVTDTGIWTVGLLVLGAVVFAHHIRHGGFHYDDWANYATSHYSYGGNFAGGVHAFFDLAGYRPGTAIYVPITQWVLGLHMHWHLAWAVVLGAALSAAVYHLLRMTGIPRVDAGVIAALALVFPYSDSTRLWAVAGLSSFAILLFVLGAIVGLYAVSAGGRRALLLHAGATALFLASVLTYELTAAPVVLMILLYRLRVPWRAALKPWLVQVGLMAIALAVFNSRDNLHQVQPFHVMFDHLREIVNEGASMFAASVVPVGSPTRAVGIGLLVLVGGGALLVRRMLGTSAPERPLLGRYLALLLAGIVTVAAGYIMFIPADPYFSPGRLGVGNRVNALATFGYVMSFYALARLAGLLLFRGLPRARTWALATTLILSLIAGVSFTKKVEHDAGNYDKAYALERQVLGTIHTLVPRPAPGTTLYSFDHAGFYAPGVPVFGAEWDLNGAVKVEYHNGSLSAQPILQGMALTCAPDGVTPGTSGGGASHGQVPYGHAVAVDIAKQQAIALNTRADCVRATKRFQPGPAQLVAS